VPGANAKGTSKFEVALESVGLCILKGAFSGSTGGGISDSVSLSFCVSFGVVFLRPLRQKRAATKAQRTTTIPTTTPAIAPAGRPPEESLDVEEEGEDDAAKVCVASGAAVVPVGDTNDGPDVVPSSVELAVGSKVRNVRG